MGGENFAFSGAASHLAHFSNELEIMMTLLPPRVARSEKKSEPKAERK